MTVMQEQAIEMIKNMPDDKIYYVINILKKMETSVDEKASALTKAQKAYKDFQRFRKSSPLDRD